MNNNIKTDCIFFGDLFEDTDMFCCKYSHNLYEQNEDMCHLCRLWDAYIPITSTLDEINTAIEWQNKSYADQEDYDDYFNE